MSISIGVETGYKPFPRIVHENAHLFTDVRTVIDIGAGRGRFVQYFLKGEYRCGRTARNNGRLYHVKAPVSFMIEEYVAVEPYEPFCRRLSSLRDPRLKVICARWEDVRAILRRRFDMVIFWDVLMFLSLEPYQVLEELIEMTGKYFLFSLHPTKNGILPQSKFREILAWIDSHPKLKLIAKTYLNRVYRKTF